MAFDGGRMVARMLIGCVEDRGYFALFDAEDNEKAVHGLMEEAIRWQKRHGIRRMIGPVAPHPLDLGGGVLTDGFEEPAAFCDPYNAPYYDRLLTDAGAVPFEEQAAYRVSRKAFDAEKYEKTAKWLKKRFGYEVAEEMADSPRALNEAVCRVMGGEADRERMAQAIEAVRPFLQKEMCPVVCVHGKPVGYLLTLQGRSGRARIVTMWVHEAWRRKGATAILFDAAAHAMEWLGIDEIDASWVRTDNSASVMSIENAGGRLIHRYRMYRMDF